MKCHKCGQQLPDDSVFCQYCGEPVSAKSTILHTDEKTQKAFIAYILSYVTKLNCCTHNRFEQDEGFYWAKEIIEQAFWQLTAGNCDSYVRKGGFSVSKGQPLTPEEKVYMDLFDILLYGDYSSANRAVNLSAPVTVNLQAYVWTLNDFLKSDDAEIDELKTQYEKLYDNAFGTDNSSPSTDSEAVRSNIEGQRRYESYEEIPFAFEPQFQGNLPVLLRTVTLKKGVSSGQISVSCEFQSLSSDIIVAMKVAIQGYDIWRQVIGEPVNYEYLDLHVSRDDLFGKKQSVVLPDPNTRIVDVCVTKIVLNNGTILVGNGDNSQLPIGDDLDTFFGHNRNLLEEYRVQTTKDAKYAPIECDPYWICSCGAINRSDEDSCHKCRVSKKDAFSALDKAFLQSSINKKKAKAEELARKQQETAAEKARRQQEIAMMMAEQKAAKAAQKRKTIRTIGLVAGAILILTYAYFGVIQPSSRYKDALQVLEAGNYDAAHTAFEALGKYKDSQSMASEALYRKAQAYLKTGNYDAAHAAFESIGKYKDSQSMASEALYQKAEGLLKAGEYEDAAEQFKALGSYKDSVASMHEAYYLLGKDLIEQGKLHEAYEVLTESGSKKYKDTEELANSAEYQYANICFDNGLFHEAAMAYRNIKDYEDSAERGDEAYYLYAGKLFSVADYINAYECYSSLGQYKDSEKQAKESYYQHGLVLLENNMFGDAVPVFEKLDDYSDSKKKLQVAKYGLGCQYIEHGRYEKAVDLFEELGKYSDSAKKRIEAMYNYVTTHRKNTDVKTYEYLKVLKKEGKKGYKDSAEIYKSLFAWNVELVALNTKIDDISTIERSISKKADYLHFIFRLSGGPPNGKITMTHTVIWPSGGKTKASWDWENYTAGETFGCAWGTGPYSDVSNAKAGILTIRVYDKETGDFLGEGSVRLD